MPGGRNAAAVLRRRDARRCGELDDAIEIEVALGQVGETLEPRFEIAMLARLHETEMALGQSKRLVARDTSRGSGIPEPRSAPDTSL